MSRLNCQISLPESSSSEPAKGLRVGDVVPMACQADPVSERLPQMKIESIELRMDKSEKHQMKLLQIVKNTSEEIVLEVTSYTVGDHDLKTLQLVDDTHSLAINPVRFRVTSVQDSKQPIKEPIGPLGPAEFDFPRSVLIGILLLLLVAGYLVFHIIRKRRRIVQLQNKIKALDKGTKPAPEFFYQTKNLLRNLDVGLQSPDEVLAALDKSFRIYLLRTYGVETENVRLIPWMKTAQKKHPHRITGGLASDLQRELINLEKLSSVKDGSVSADDIQKTIRALIRLTEKIQLQMSQARTSRGDT